MKRVFAVLSIVALLAAGCSSKEPESGTSPTAAAGPQTLPVKVGGTNTDRTAAFNAFFPDTLTARPGDTLEFKPEFNGEPHTVTFGTVVDAGLAAAEKQTAPGPEPPEMLKVIDVFGPPPMFAPLNQASAQPCFLDSGEPPTVAACPKQEQPELTGKQAWYNLGFLQGESAYEVKLADDIAPGTYNFVCVIHRAPMGGKVTVVGENDARPDAAAVSKKGDEQLAKASKDFQPILDQTAASATAANGVAGPISDNPDAAGITFAPKEVTIPAGGSVSWQVMAFHTIAINPPPEAFGVLIKKPDGSVELNQKAGAPTKAKPAPVLFPPTPDLKATTFDAGTYDGTGFFNSGLVVSFPPALLTYKLGFSKPGTYEVRCLLHPDMMSKVTVT